MHILIIPSAFPGPYNAYAGIFYQEMALGLHDSGIKTGVIAPDIRPVKEIISLKQWKEFGKEAAYELKPGLPVLRKTAINLLPFRKDFNRRIFGRYSEKLFLQYVDRYGKPDILHAHTTQWAGWAAMQISKKFDVPYVITEHSSAFLKNSLTPSEVYFHQQVYAQAKSVCAVSTAIGNAMYDKTGKQSELIPNFIDTRKYEVRHQSRKPRTLCSIGNLLKTKGFAELLQAFSKLLSIEADFRLIVIGDGPERTHLIQLSHSLGIDANVQFTGAILPEQVKEYLSQTDIYVSASHFETFGVSIVEAMASGIPVVATRCGGPEETVVKQAGILCKKQDPNALFDAILYVYRNYHQYLPEQIRAHIEKNYSREAVLRRQVNIYNQAIGKE